jgi:hypothetical protein
MYLSYEKFGGAIVQLISWQTLVVLFATVIVICIFSEDFRERCVDFLMDIAEDIVKRIIVGVTVIAVSIILLFSFYAAIQSNATQPVQITQPTPTIIVPATPQEDPRNPSTTEHTTYLPFVAQ